MQSHMKDHWNEIYNSKETENLGWYEKTPFHCLELFEKCDLYQTDPIIDIGCGTSSFIDKLLDRGFSNLIGLDISKIALETLKQRMGERAVQVKWVIDDVTMPREVTNLRDVALWHDRAVLHFLLEDQQQQNYLQTLKTVLRENGFVIISIFNLSGVRECSGLETKNYSEKTLSEFLTNDFELKESFNYVYQTPWGKPRPYIYTLFQRIR